jgi:hypothetical protein
MPTIAVMVLCSIGALEIDTQGKPIPPAPPWWNTIQDAIPPAIFYFFGGGILMGTAAVYLKDKR